MTAFAVSLFLLVWSSLTWSGRTARDAGERFWLFWAGVTLQIGAITAALSLFHLLIPAAWLAIQIAISALMIFWLRRSEADLAGISPALADVWKRLVALHPVALAALGTAAVICLHTGIAQFVTPIPPGDARMYHASRVLYWIQQSSVLSYVTHNDRQVVFSFGGELFFLWPVLFTKSEVMGRLVFWTGFPAALTGLYLVARALGAGRAPAVTACLMFSATPIVLEQAIGLKPDLWLVAYVTGATFWVVRAVRSSGASRRDLFWAGLFTSLAINVKFYALLLVVPLALAILTSTFLQQRRLACQRAVSGLVIGAVASGLLVVLLQNVLRDGHPFGPEGFRRVHQSELTADQLYTHLVRLPFVLFELPEVPIPALRDRLTDAGESAAARLGADRHLPGEATREEWPGLFAFEVPEHARGYSLGGIFMLPLIALGLAWLARDLIRHAPSLSPSPIAITAVTAAVLLFGIVLSVRWMAQSGVPQRFLGAPYALSLGMGASIWSQRLRRKQLLTSAAIPLIVVTIYHPARTAAHNAWNSGPFYAEWVDDQFAEPLAGMPAGASILLVGQQASPDYPLFNARNGYPNRVTSWGKSKFTPERLQQIIDRHAITHVLVERADGVDFHWESQISTAAMVEWLAQRPGIRLVPLTRAPNMRLFETPLGTRLASAAPSEATVRELPEERPLIVVDDSLRSSFGLVPDSLGGPWPVEAIDRPARAFLWLGTGSSEGLRFAGVSKKAQTVQVLLDVSPGPSRVSPERPLELIVNGVPAGTATITEPTVVALTVQLAPGRNHLELLSTAEADIERMPNGDTRHLIVGLNRVTMSRAGTPES